MAQKHYDMKKAIHCTKYKKVFVGHPQIAAVMSVAKQVFIQKQQKYDDGSESITVQIHFVPTDKYHKQMSKLRAQVIDSAYIIPSKLVQHEQCHKK